MHRSAFSLVGEWTRAPSFAALPRSTQPLLSAGGALTLSPSQRSARPFVKGKRIGRIAEWDPFERCGVVVESEGGRRYRIANTRAFETVLPTMLRSLEGAVVEFDVGREASNDRVIIRNRLTPITAESYRQKPPIDFLSPEMLRWAGPRRAASIREGTSGSSDAEKGKDSAQESKAADEAEEMFARNIIVDIDSIPATQIARWSGPLSEEPVIKPTKNLKDMRGSRLFDAETNTYLRLKQRLGSTAEAQRIVAEQRDGAEKSVIRREVITEKTEGVISTWSGIYRSGLIREGVRNQGEESLAHGALPAALEDAGGTAAETLCIIRNAHAFQSALPTSQNLQNRRVVFTKVSYSVQPHRYYAENIVVVGDVHFDGAVSSREEAHATKKRERVAAAQHRCFGALIMEDEDDGRAERVRQQSSNAKQPAEGGWGENKHGAVGTSSPSEENSGPLNPERMLYGVIVRWSGGQGVVEAGDGRHFYLRSTAVFEQLVDTSSPHLRGAVVQFKEDATRPRYACQVSILSTASTSISEVKPLLDKNRLGAFAGDGDEPVASSEAAAAPPKAVPKGVEWSYGTLISWSSVEGQGIILDEADPMARYVLRDPDENILDYSAKRALLKKGRRVKFTPFGSAGRLACNVVLLDAEVAEEALADEELRHQEPQLSIDGNKDEAIPSPMSTSYWLNRMDKAGYDTNEVKKLQNRALRLDEDEDDGTEGGKFLDSEELLKKDHWWSDPRKNVRFPNSDMTAGHLALIGPASLMNVAMKTKNPNGLDKMLKKYQSRLTEEQKEYAWKQAKEMAPKYEECIRKGRERNEEPTFYFF
ncbi:hypothetical protein JKF63_02735 [Porcisia hertigi]|uniref:Uncharacterized protein n=1 Tax=Porcisia hertigi TaxID=2761500 RepID=A0A836LDU6_9TRYP|nr:hypothetical protein JKF63_02735 [Porcisia hertigi]